MISIGMLAYNEAKIISRSILSLSTQHLFSRNEYLEQDIEFIIVANGCSDNTADVSREALRTLASLAGVRRFSWRVEEVDRPGICNAWNRYVHDFANQSADVIIMMGGDIQLDAPTTLTAMIDLLASRSEVSVAVDEPIKDTMFVSNPTPMQRLSNWVSSLSGRRRVPGQPTWLCGQLYAGRGDIIREIYLPSDLATEDSLLYDLVVTDCLRDEPRPERVVLAPNASHIFEAYTTIPALMRHERWLIAALVVKEIVLEDLRREMGERRQNAGSIIQSRNETQPDWLAELVANALRERGWWLISSEILFRRIAAFNNIRWQRQVVFAPLAITALAVDLVAAVTANVQLRRQHTLFSHTSKHTGH